MRTRETREKGQELVEVGLAMGVLILMVGGIVQFGHAFMVQNMVTHAARDGARLAATWADRGVCQQLQNTSAIETSVRDRIASVMGSTFANDTTNLHVNIAQAPTPSAGAPCTAPTTTPTVTVTVNGCVPYLFNMLGFSIGGCANGFRLNRPVTFDDELRTGAGA